MREGPTLGRKPNMKANQTFKEADEAVSPVIGVILMVAITVVLAAVVFVLVNDLGSSDEAAPTMGFNKSGGNVTVVKAPTGTEAITYADLAFGGTCDLTYFDGALIGGGETVENNNTVQGTTVAGGQSFGGCTGGETLTISHVATGTLLQQYSF